MAPALESFIAAKYFDKMTQDAAKNLSIEAIQAVIEQVEADSDSGSELASEIEEFEKEKNKYINKLKSIKYSVMFPDEILNQTSIEMYYEDLIAEDDATLLEMTIAIKKHFRKLKTDKDLEIQKLLNSFNTIGIGKRIAYNDATDTLSKTKSSSLNRKL